MLGYALRRLAWGGVVFIAITMSTFVLFFVIPTNTVSGVRGRDITGGLAGNVGVHGSIGYQYVQFLGRIVVHGSLGRATSSRQDVNELISKALPVTASLIVGGAVFWLLIAIPIGILSALRPRSLFDRVAMIFVLIGISAHPIWLGLILSYVLGFRFGVMPIGGYCDFFHPQFGSGCGGPTQWAFHLLLPWLTFAMLFAALYVRMIRAVLIENLESDYVLTAKAKGASPARILRGHVARNALLPIVTMLGMDMTLGLSNVIFVESVYGLPGLGRVAVRSLTRQDLAPLLGVIVTVTVAIIAFNLVVDLIYAWLDPRIGLSRMPEEEQALRPATQSAVSLASGFSRG